MLTLRAQAKAISPDLWRAVGAGLAVPVLFFVVVGLVTGAIDTPILERQTPLLADRLPHLGGQRGPCSARYRG